jgi:hypothetical protein
VGDAKRTTEHDFPVSKRILSFGTVAGLVHYVTAVGRQGGAYVEPAVGTSQQQRGRGDLLRPAEASDRQRIDEGLAVRWRHGRRQVGDDRARRDGVDAHTFRRRLPRHRAREAHDRGLGGRVDRRVDRALQAAL